MMRIVVPVFVVVVGNVDVLVVDFVLRLPSHFVLLLEASSGVGKPRADLRQRHLGDDGEHDLLALCGVRILFVFVEPGLEGGRGLASRVFPPRRQIVAAAITGKTKGKENDNDNCLHSLKVSVKYCRRADETFILELLLFHT